jgi:hypothetical protein
MGSSVLNDLEDMLKHALSHETPLVALRREVLGEVLLEIGRLRRENTHLRAMVGKVECPYGHRLPTGFCALGYPGCACEDDLVALLEAVHDERGPWRKADASLPVCTPHEEMGIYESDDGGHLWYFRCTHWRPIGDPRP